MRRQALNTKFEGLFIFPEEMEDEALNASVEQVKEEIGKLGGSVEGVVRLGKRTFARPMGKKTAGHYVNMDLMMDGLKMDALKGRLKLASDVFRVQFIKKD